jgi:hypothetical protein
MSDNIIPFPQFPRGSTKERMPPGRAADFLMAEAKLARETHNLARKQFEFQKSVLQKLDRSQAFPAGLRDEAYSLIRDEIRSLLVQGFSEIDVPPLSYYEID